MIEDPVLLIGPSRIPCGHILDSNSALNMMRNRTSSSGLICPLCRQEWNVFVRVPILSSMINELKKFKNMNKLEKLRESFKAAANALFK